jgi:hypothetical protein
MMTTPTTLTHFSADMDKATTEKLKGAIARWPERSNWGIAKNYKGISAGDVAAVREGMTGTTHHGEPNPEPKQSLSGGFSLASRRVLSRRPAESAAKFIKRLPNGKGYPPRDLAAQWGMSEETIRRHARDLGCLKFVEIAEDDWQPLIMNPETAAKYDL